MRRMSLPKKIFLYFVSIILAIWILGPILWAVSASFQLDNALFTRPARWIPENPTIDNYRYIITREPPPIYQRAEMGHRPAGDVLAIIPALRNSAIVASVVTVLNLIITVPAAYAFSRLRFTGKGVSFVFIMGSRLIPAIALAIPIYAIVNRLGLLDTYIALILVYLAFTLPFTIWFMTKFFDFLPPDTEDAARVDGCTRLGALIRVVIPVTLPGLAATAAVAFMAAYSEFLFAVLLTQTMNSRTVPVVLASAAINHDVSYALASTALVISVIPPIIFALIFRRYITRGLSMAFGT
jgi:multiple sugar transport system permease protein